MQFRSFLRLLWPAAAMVWMTAIAQGQSYQVLYSFTGGVDGGQPSGGLVEDTSGNLYGVTVYGGAFANGVVFELTPSAGLMVLHAFTGYPTDGANPNAGLLKASGGGLLGIAPNGGLCTGCGVVFQVALGIETLLYEFQGSTDGGMPQGPLVKDQAGNIYGTTFSGGHPQEHCVNLGCGVVFRLSTAGKETALHRFKGRSDGGNPRTGLLIDLAGNLYGTTSQSGTTAYACFPMGCGVVFEVAPNGEETILHTFTGGPADGADPRGTLVQDKSGALYGTTYSGGAAGLGTVFKIDTDGTYTVLHSFMGPEGAQPLAGLTLNSGGTVCGTASTGGSGAGGAGTVFEMDSKGNVSVLYAFSGGSDGGNPAGNLRIDARGNLYGTASTGGSYGAGVVFKITPGSAGAKQSSPPPL